MNDKKVTIYSTPTCHFCHMLKEYFRERGIAYTEYDVSSDAERRKEMVDKSGQLGVPVILIEELIIGFDRQRIDRALGLSE